MVAKKGIIKRDTRAYILIKPIAFSCSRYRRRRRRSFPRRRS